MCAEFAKRHRVDLCKHDFSHVKNQTLKESPQAEKPKISRSPVGTPRQLLFAHQKARLHIKAGNVLVNCGCVFGCIISLLIDSAATQIHAHRSALMCVLGYRLCIRRRAPLPKAKELDHQRVSDEEQSSWLVHQGFCRVPADWE